MKDIDPRRVPDDKAASLEEVAAACESLTDADSRRLLRSAEILLAGLGRKGVGLSAEDLLQEAVTLTLEGRRRWNKAAVGFPRHLRSVIASICSHRAGQTEEAFLECESPEMDQEGKTVESSISSHPTQLPDPYRILDAAQQVEAIKDTFAGDPIVCQITDGMLADMSGPEIQECLGLSQTEYETAMKRLRRTARKKLGY